VRNATLSDDRYYCHKNNYFTYVSAIVDRKTIVSTFLALFDVNLFEIQLNRALGIDFDHPDTSGSRGIGRREAR
jgi:hypothetical protein